MKGVDLNSSKHIRFRYLVLDIVVGLRRHEHLRPHLSAAAGWPVAAAGGGVGSTRTQAKRAYGVLHATAT